MNAEALKNVQDKPEIFLTVRPALSGCRPPSQPANKFFPITHLLAFASVASYILLVELLQQVRLVFRFAKLWTLVAIAAVKYCTRSDTYLDWFIDHCFARRRIFSRIRNAS
jgi:hypothetical protein